LRPVATNEPIVGISRRVEGARAKTYASRPANANGTCRSP
jgi:hypothetical protein